MTISSQEYSRLTQKAQERQLGRYDLSKINDYRNKVLGQSDVYQQSPRRQGRGGQWRLVEYERKSFTVGDTREGTVVRESGVTDTAASTGYDIQTRPVTLKQEIASNRAISQGTGTAKDVFGGNQQVQLTKENVSALRERAAINEEQALFRAQSAFSPKPVASIASSPNKTLFSNNIVVDTSKPQYEGGFTSAKTGRDIKLITYASEEFKQPSQIKSPAIQSNRLGSIQLIRKAAESPTGQYIKSTLKGSGMFVVDAARQAPSSIVNTFKTFERGALSLSPATRAYNVETNLPMSYRESFGARTSEFTKGYRDASVLLALGGTPKSVGLLTTKPVVTAFTALQAKSTFDAGKMFLSEPSGENLGRTLASGTIGASLGVQFAGTVVKPALIRAIGKPVPIEKYYSQKVLNKEARLDNPKGSGTERLAETFRRAEQARTSSFKVRPYSRRFSQDFYSPNLELAGNRFIIDTPKKISGYNVRGKVELVSAAQRGIKSDKVGLSPKAAANLEDPIIYYSAKRYAESGFLRLSQDSAGDGYSFSLVPSLDSFRTPTTVVTKVSDVKLLPKEVLDKAGFLPIAEFGESIANKGPINAFVTKRSLIGFKLQKPQILTVTQDVTTASGSVFKKGTRRLESGSKEDEYGVLYSQGITYARSKGLRGRISSALFKAKREYVEFDTGTGFVPVPTQELRLISRKGKNTLKQSRKDVPSVDTIGDFNRRTISSAESYISARRTVRPSIISSVKTSRSVSRTSGSRTSRISRQSRIVSGLSGFSSVSSTASGVSGVSSPLARISRFSSPSSSLSSFIRGSSQIRGGSSITSQSFFTPPARSNRLSRIDKFISKPKSRSSVFVNRRKFKYTPTATALGFSIKGKKLTGQLSGLEFRGVA